MAIFSRFRREADPPPEQPVRAVLPDINQRVTVSRPGGQPSPTRVEDHTERGLVIAAPDLRLHPGERVLVSWEAREGWFGLATTVAEVESTGGLPTVTVSSEGHLSRFGDRRLETRREIVLPLELRVVVARVVKPGRVLQTTTSELSTGSLRFVSSSPFAPGDVLEARITLREGEWIGARIRVVRVDASQGTWRQSISTVYEDILRSDRARIAAFLDAGEMPAAGPSA